MAKWIWYAQNAKPDYMKNEYVEFKRDFTIENIDKKASICISADSEYALFLNGTWVGACQYDDYPDEKVYDSYEIGHLLKEGENTLWISAYYQGDVSLQYAVGIPGLWFSLENGKEKIESDEATLCRRSGKYQSGAHYKITGQLGYSFTYDADGADAPWEAAVETAVETRLVPRPIEKLVFQPFSCGKVISQGYFYRSAEGENPAVNLSRDALSFRRAQDLFGKKKEVLTMPILLQDPEMDGAYLIFDMERESVGYLTLSLTAEAGTLLEIGFGEHLTDLRVRTAVGGRNFAMSYRCKEGEQTFTHWFKRLGCRYLQVHISHFKQITIHGIGLICADYPVKRTGEFVSADPLHNEIFSVAADTLHLCMHEHYEDCPWREQGLYGFDSRNQMLAGYYAFGEYPFARASLDLLGHRHEKNGQTPICAPSDFMFSSIPSFSLWWIQAMQEYMEYSGDQTLAEKHWDWMTEMIRTNLDWEQDGIVTPRTCDGLWHFYEWSEGYGGYSGENDPMKGQYGEEGVHAGIYHLIFWQVYRCMIRMAEEMGKKDFVAEHQPRLEKYAETFCKHFWSEENQAFASFDFKGEIFHYAELTNALVLYSGICDDEKKKEAIFQHLQKDSLPISISLSYSVFKYESMLQYRPSCAKEVFDCIGKRWGKMLEAGATSFWETDRGEADFGEAGSLCHGWAGIPVYFYLRYGAGIKADGSVEDLPPVFDRISAKAMMNHKVIQVKK